MTTASVCRCFPSAPASLWTFSPQIFVFCPTEKEERKLKYLSSSMWASAAGSVLSWCPHLSRAPPERGQSVDSDLVPELSPDGLGLSSESRGRGPRSALDNSDIPAIKITTLGTVPHEVLGTQDTYV